MQIALFGGSFDPPHLGHLLVAKTLVTEKYVDEVWFVPCADHPFNKTMSPALTRLTMLEEIPGLKVSKCELDNAGKSYSIKTLEHLVQAFPEHSFSWVIGTDQLKKFSLWHRYQDILKKFEVFVYPRLGFATEPLYPGMKVICNGPEIALSSTEIRALVQNKQEFASLVPEAVARYIKKTRLYN